MLEAIIACGIISTAVSSALTLVQLSISAEKESENNIVAANLAREGIEVVRAIRDSNWLADDVWDKGLEGDSFDYTAVPVFSPQANSWSLDFTPNDIADATAGVYRYTAGSDVAAIGLQVQAAAQPEGTVALPFSRLLTLDVICQNGEVREVKESGTGCVGTKIGVRIRSRVHFKVSGRSRDIEAEESIYNWR